MRILLIGSGSREHALAWKLRSSPLCKELYCVPSSSTVELETQAFCEADHLDYEALAELIKERGVDVVICGPEKPLADGFVDKIWSINPACRVLGPSQAAAQLESSKSFAKSVMASAKIPTAEYELALSYERAKEKSLAVLKENSGVVLKADGLAGGKGVFVCHTEKELEAAFCRLENLFSPGEVPKILIEEELIGREFSYFSLVNHKFHTPLGCAVDFKRLGASDTGPNTGGMGAYTPVPWLPSNWESEIKEKVVDPLLAELVKRGIPYTGVLYCGLMLTASGVKVIEFNVRLGDPEAQVLLANEPRDFLQMFLESSEKKEGYTPFSSSSSKSLGIVLTSSDYPYCSEPSFQSDSSLPSSVFKNERAPYAFGASLKKKEDFFLPGKGRVMTIVGQDQKSFKLAKEQAKKKISELKSYWKDCYSRDDIGDKIIAEEMGLEKNSRN